MSIGSCKQRRYDIIGDMENTKYDRKFFVEKGRKGGLKGGQTTKERYGKEHYSIIGKMKKKKTNLEMAH